MLHIRNSLARLGKLHPAFSENACDVFPVGGMQQVPWAVSDRCQTKAQQGIARSAKMKMLRIRRSQQNPTKDRCGNVAKASMKVKTNKETKGI